MKFNKRKYLTDLWIILVSTSIVYGIMGIFYMWFNMDMDEFSLVQKLITGAFFEYGMMGLGITIVCVRNKERFKSFGLRKEKLLLTVLLSALVCLPEFLYFSFSYSKVTYFPFQGVNFTKSILAEGFPVNLLGMAIIILIWGFFEGFTYVVISDRINKLLPSKNRLFDWGAIICGIFCILIHILSGHTYGIDMITTFIIIYGMLVVYRYTDNAWGCVLIYCFYWNAIGIR